MAQHYSNPARANDPHALPDIEVFRAKRGELWAAGAEGDSGPNAAGWYWWHCFPGCMPEGEAQGPYRTETAALKAAREEMDFGADPEPEGEGEPEDGDYVVGDTGRRGLSVARRNERFLGHAQDWDAAAALIRADAGTNYRPAVWNISDHGNAHLVRDFTW